MRYLTDDPEEKAPRNYAGFLQLDDAVIVEFNAQHGLLTDAQNEMYPWATVFIRIYRAGTMRLLWSHEESADRKGSSRNLYDYQSEPRVFLMGIEKLMPVLAKKTGAGLAAAFGDPTWAPLPAPGVSGAGVPPPSSTGGGPAPAAARARTRAPSHGGHHYGSFSTPGRRLHRNRVAPSRNRARRLRPTAPRPPPA